MVYRERTTFRSCSHKPYNPFPCYDYLFFLYYIISSCTLESFVRIVSNNGVSGSPELKRIGRSKRLMSHGPSPISHFDIVQSCEHMQNTRSRRAGKGQSQISHQQLGILYVIGLGIESVHAQGRENCYRREGKNFSKALVPNAQLEPEVGYASGDESTNF